MSNLSGKQLGPYLIEDRIALGGMAAIYRARQPSTGREVAVKVLPLVLASDPNLVTRFEREAQVLASLQHPHILPLFDFGREGGWLYFVTPLIPHGDLGDYLIRYGEALPLPEIRRIFQQLTDALDCAHQAGVVHRDLKPANVLLDARGNCLLSDFGIAKMEGSSALTSVGTALGTPEYMSPEQSTGKPVDARSDIYALGVILFELATGRVPFQADTQTVLLLKHVEEAPPPARKFNPNLPAALEQVILKALAKRPEDRYQTAGELGAAVTEALGALGKPTSGAMEPAVASGQGQTVVTPYIAPRAASPPPAASASASASDRGADAPTVAAATTKSGPNAALIVIVVASIALIAIGLWLFLHRGDAKYATTSPAPTTSVAVPAPEPRPAPPPPMARAAPPPLPAAESYDDFSDPADDGAFDSRRWTPIYGAVNTQTQQRDGALHVVSREQGKGLSATVPGAQIPHRIAVRVRLSAPAQTGSLGIILSQYPAGGLQPTWWASCFLGAKQGANTATPTCTDIGYATFPAAAPVALGTWHELALEPDPAQRQVRLFADGYPIGNLPLPAASGATPTWFVSLTAWSQDGQPIAGDFDDVVIR